MHDIGSDQAHHQISIEIVKLISVPKIYYWLRFQQC